LLVPVHVFLPVNRQNNLLTVVNVLFLQEKEYYRHFGKRKYFS
jgi:hypothetical protein